MSALLLIALRPQLAPSSRLSASHFFGGVDPQLAGLMSPALVAREDAAELRLSPVSSPSSRPDSTSFYGDVSRRLARLMRQRSVLAEDAAELDPSPASVASGAATGALPYDEAAALGTSISAAAFQRIAAAASAPLARGPAPVCHACVRAAAAAAKAKAAAAAKAAVARAAQERLQDAWQKQRADAASAAAKITRQRALIAKLQVSTQLLLYFGLSCLTFLQSDPSFPRAALQPVMRPCCLFFFCFFLLCSLLLLQMHDELQREQARAAALALSDAAAAARAMRKAQK